MAPMISRLLAFSALAITAVAGPASFNVRDRGAVGDGSALDTAAINTTIAACAAAGGGRVLFPPGRYLSGTIDLKSGVELFLEANATIVGSTNLSHYHTFTLTNTTPALPVTRWHRGLIMAEGAHDIAIAGPGAIDGQHVVDPLGEEKMRGPHGILLGHCRNFTLSGVTMTNASNYALLFLYSDAVTVTNATFAGGWDGVHFRGSLERWCRGVRISDCRFYTGDDSIAGSYWQDTIISNCVINSSCNGVRLIGPARDVAITHCDIFGPGRHEHRTSRELHRTNMLAGICLQPSAWAPMPGPMENIRVSDITMDNITTPFHIAIRTNNTAAAIVIERVKAAHAYRAACSVESWGDAWFKDVLFRDVSVQFEGGGSADDARRSIRPPRTDARKLPAWGFYARGVEQLRLENVRLTCAQDDARPMFIGDGIGRLTLDRFQCSRPVSAPDLMLLHDVRHVELRQTDLPEKELEKLRRLGN